MTAGENPDARFVVFVEEAGFGRKARPMGAMKVKGAEA
jgi:hypothetical protein